MVALLDTGDIGRLPCGIVGGIPSLAAGHTAAAGVDRGLFDDIEAVSVAKVVQRTGYAACRKQNQVVPLLFPFEQLARRYGRPQVGYGLECCRIPVDRQLPPGVADGAEADLERYVLRITAFGLCLEAQGVKYRVASAPYHRIGNLERPDAGYLPCACRVRSPGCRTSRLRPAASAVRSGFSLSWDSVRRFSPRCRPRR